MMCDDLWPNAAQTFVERPAAARGELLHTLALDHAEAAIRTHGLGITPAAVNAAYQALGRAFIKLSQVAGNPQTEQLQSCCVSTAQHDRCTPDHDSDAGTDVVHCTLSEGQERYTATVDSWWTLHDSGFLQIGNFAVHGSNITCQVTGALRYLVKCLQIMFADALKSRLIAEERWLEGGTRGYPLARAAALAIDVRTLTAAASPGRPSQLDQMRLILTGVQRSPHQQLLHKRLPGVESDLLHQMSCATQLPIAC